MTSISTAEPLTNEAKFLTDLEGILNPDFKARVYPSADGKIRIARVNTEQPLDGVNLRQLITLAAKWNLPISVSRSGAGLRILFGKE